MSSVLISIENYSKAAGITAFIVGDPAKEEEIIKSYTALAHWNAQSFCHRYSHHPDCTMDKMDESKHFKKALFNQYKKKAEASDKSKVKLMIWLSKFFHSVRYQNCEEEEADSKTIDILESLMEMMFNALAPNYDEECRWWWEIEL